MAPAAILTGASNVTTVNSGAGTGTAVVLNKPTNLADGHFLVALCMIRQGVTTLGLPSGFTKVDDGTGGSAPSGIIAVKYVPTASGEPASYTFTWSVSTRIAGILAIATGLDIVNYVTPKSGSGAFSTITSANVALSFAAGTGNTDDLKVCWCTATGTESSNTYTPTGPLAMAGSTTFSGTTAIMGWLGGCNWTGSTDALQFTASASIPIEYNSIVLPAASAARNPDLTTAPMTGY